MHLKMAYVPRSVKYLSSIQSHQGVNMTGYTYGGSAQSQVGVLTGSGNDNHTDENRNENNCGNKELCQRSNQNTQQSSATQTVSKVDAATMTDPLQIDFRLTSEYLARCSSTLGLPYVFKYDDNSNNSSQNYHDVRPKLELEIEPQHINGESIVKFFLNLRSN